MSSMPNHVPGVGLSDQPAGTLKTTYRGTVTNDWSAGAPINTYWGLAITGQLAGALTFSFFLLF